MKKILNKPEEYTDDMLRGIYAAHQGKVHFVSNDLRCYCIKDPEPGKVAIITGGGTGHLPLFLGYVGKNLLDGCAVGGVFQSPSAEQIFSVTKAVEQGAGVLYLYGNYTGDIMNFDMAAELCEFENIATRSIVGTDDIHSAPPEKANNRRGVAGIFFMYKCAGAKAAAKGTLDEVLAAAEKAKNNTRTVGFALSPCIIPEVGHPNFVLSEGEMAMGMGIHGEPGIWNGPVKTAMSLAQDSVKAILADMPFQGEAALLINGLGATSLEELYILCGNVIEVFQENHIQIVKTYVGEFATSMEMAGASISVIQLDKEIKEWLALPVNTPFYSSI
ncbi:MAG: dihydroxyacetone kinase subunit DhaK [Clostridiales Family XIII bacterium]|nr:dihydroxyacetone kinase subunit DhaK [Clostridiales Family XIII bacterium]